MMLQVGWRRSTSQAGCIQITSITAKDSGYLTKYGYIGQGDVNRMQFAHGQEVKYSYNPLRHLQEMEDWLGLTKIATDPLGRAWNVQYPDGKTVSYTYGKAGERTSITYPDGRTVSYGFDEQVRLSELRDGDQVITYGYDAAGRLTEKHFPNGLHTDYRYDSKGQIKELIHKDQEGILDKYTYQYDLLGNKTGIEKQRRGLGEESGTYQYGYDPLGRLNEVTKDNNPLRTYEYDAFGNRTRLMERGKQTTYAYNTMNQLLSRLDADVEETYTYDKRGNLSQISANGQIKNQYLYGALNRLEQAVNGKKEAARYQYNGLGHRVGKEIGRENFQLINEGLDPAKQLQSQTISPEKKIQYTIDLTREYHNLLQKEEHAQTQTFLWDGNVAGILEDGKDSSNYYLQDELGSPLRLADQNGHLCDSYGYDEFGKDLYEIQRVIQHFGYTGYQKDQVVDSYFAQAREYQPESGRFLGEDLNKGYITMPFTMNPYTYCFNAPQNYVDLDGQWPSFSDIGNGIKKGLTVVKDIASNVIDKVGTGIKTAGEAVQNFYQEHKTVINIVGGVAVIGVCAVATVATGGLAAGTLVGAVSQVALTGAVIGGGVGAAGNGITAAILGDDIKTAMAEGFGWGSITGTISGAFAGSGIGIAGQVIANAGISTGDYMSESWLNDRSISPLGMVLSVIGGAFAGAIGGAGFMHNGSEYSKAAELYAKTIARVKGQEMNNWAIKRLASAQSYLKDIIHRALVNTSLRMIFGGLGDKITELFTGFVNGTESGCV